MSTRLDRLEDHRFWTWVVVGLLTGAFGTAFLFLLTKIDSRFDRVDEPLGEVQSAIASQTTAMGSMERTLERIEDRIDGSQSQRSAGTGQAQPVR